MTHRTASIGGDGQGPTVTELYDWLAALPDETAQLSLKAWGASGDGYGEVEAGWRVEARW